LNYLKQLSDEKKRSAEGVDCEHSKAFNVEGVGFQIESDREHARHKPRLGKQFSQI